MNRCPSTDPTLWTVQCDLEEGHQGQHRSNMVVWNHPAVVLVDGKPAELGDTDHWIDGEVYLTGDEPPL